MNEPESHGDPAASPRPEFPPTAPPPAPPEVPSPGLASRLIGVLFSPGAAFRQVASRPAWVGALGVYLLCAVLMSLVYAMNADWEAVMRAQFEDSLAWKAVTALLSEDQIDAAERSAVNEITATGTGGMALLTPMQTLVGSAIVFHVMAILFATLFYLMGSFADLRLGRVYLDAFVCLLVLIAYSLGGAFVRGIFGLDARDALPFQAGINLVFFSIYLWLLYRSVERQPPLRRLAAVYAHSMVIPAIAALLSIVIVLLHSGPVTVPANEVLRSNLASILGVKGAGVAASFLGSIEIFNLWQLAVLAVGFAAVTGFSLGTAAAITFLPWGFWTMAKIAVAAGFGG